MPATIADILAQHRAGRSLCSDGRGDLRAHRRTRGPGAVHRAEASRRGSCDRRGAAKSRAPRASRCGAFLSPSKTISMSPACRPPRRVPPSPIGPQRSAFVVERLERAGAIVVGKTNLDQFATGLVGVRSPYGVPRNALRADLIPGGSSSGSATAVGAGLAPFALGTDTAGSGRVPAALNGIVGLNRRSARCRRRASFPPAARSTPSRFSPSMSPMRSRPFKSPAATTRPTPFRARCRPPRFRPGRKACGSASRAPTSSCSSTTRSPSAPSREDLERSLSLGAEIVEFDFEPFAAVARLLYEGPWVAERFAATKPLIEERARSAASGHPRHHRGGPQIRRGHGLRGDLQARRTQTRGRARLESVRHHAGSDACHAFTRSRRSRPIPSASIRVSGPTPISSTFSTSPRSLRLRACEPTACPRA